VVGPNHVTNIVMLALHLLHHPNMVAYPDPSGNIIGATRLKSIPIAPGIDYRGNMYLNDKYRTLKTDFSNSPCALFWNGKKANTLMIYFNGTYNSLATGAWRNSKDEISFIFSRKYLNAFNHLFLLDPAVQLGDRDEPPYKSYLNELSPVGPTPQWSVRLNINNDWGPHAPIYDDKTRRINRTDELEEVEALNRAFDALDPSRLGHQRGSDYGDRESRGYPGIRPRQLPLPQDDDKDSHRSHYSYRDIDIKRYSDSSSRRDDRYRPSSSRTPMSELSKRATDSRCPDIQARDKEDRYVTMSDRRRITQLDDDGNSVRSGSADSRRPPRPYDDDCGSMRSSDSRRTAEFNDDRSMRSSASKRTAEFDDDRLMRSSRDRRDTETSSRSTTSRKNHQDDEEFENDRRSMRSSASKRPDTRYDDQDDRRSTRSSMSRRDTETSSSSSRRVTDDDIQKCKEKGRDQGTKKVYIAGDFAGSLSQPKSRK
jgi:hypothetical protein